MATTLSQKWLLSIEADPEWVKGKLIEVKTLALPDVDEDLLLPPGEIDEPDYEGPEHEAQELEPGQEPVLSLDQAAQVVNADGKRYIDMASVDLLQLWGDIKKSIESRPELSEDVVAEWRYKMGAILTITAARQQQEKQQEQQQV